MEWMELLNDAIQYIEDNLDGEISYDTAAKIAGCSSFHFQRMFAYMADMSLGEYIRKRRMTLAAIDLQSHLSVLDTALKYGYNSPTSFNRAFQSIHGIPPSKARMEGAVLKSYSPISFRITIQGVVEMNFRIENRKAFRVVGIAKPISTQIEENFKIIPAMWTEFISNGTKEKVCSLMDETEPKGMLGICDCRASEEWCYIIGVASSKPVEAGLLEFEIPESTWAVFPGNGNSADIQNLTQRILTEWLPNSGYKFGNAPDIEVYLDEPSDNMHYEIWIPIEK